MMTSKQSQYSRGVRAGLAALLAASVVLSASGCGKGSNKNIKIDGVTGPNLAFVDGKLTMNVVLQNLSVDAGLRIPLPDMPNSFLEIGPDFQSNGFLISLGVDIKDVKDKIANIGLLDPNTLPGGRPLPGVAAGFLPSFAVEVPQLNHMVFYFNTNVIGVFVPVKIGLQNYIATFRFYDGAGDRIGNISVVGEDKDKKNGGFLLMLDLTGKVGALMNM